MRNRKEKSILIWSELQNRWRKVTTDVKGKGAKINNLCRVLPRREQTLYRVLYRVTEISSSILSYKK